MGFRRLKELWLALMAGVGTLVGSHQKDPVACGSAGVALL
jgi:hypothetical protein